LKEDEFDIAGAATGVVDADLQLGAERVKEGDVIIAMPASGIHANGFSLVRHIIATQELDITRNYDFSKSLGEVLLTPTEIYTLDCLALIKAQQENIRTFSHITGGGLADNTARVIPDGLTAIYDRSTWSLPQEMKFLGDVAGVPLADLERTWNVGIGMSAIVDPVVADLIVRSLAARGMKAWIAGKVEKAAEMGSPRSYLASQYKQ
jgi:phosphoribosylformylglycinamidine cyclo-ligase